MKGFIKIIHNDSREAVKSIMYINVNNIASIRESLDGLKTYILMTTGVEYEISVPMQTIIEKICLSEIDI